MAAQVCTFKGVEALNHNVKRLVVYCKCDTTKATYDDAILCDEERPRIQGKILCVDTKPGEAAPTNGYDLTLENEEGIDIMGGALADRSATAAERAYPIYYNGVGQVYHPASPPVRNCLTVTLANNSVNGADWWMYIYFEKSEDEGLG